MKEEVRLIARTSGELLCPVVGYQWQVAFGEERPHAGAVALGSATKRSGSLWPKRPPKTQCATGNGSQKSEAVILMLARRKQYARDQ